MNDVMGTSGGKWAKKRNGTGNLSKGNNPKYSTLESRNLI